MRTLVWFRGKDLRVDDHLPLLEAAHAGETIPLFVLDPYFFAPERAKELPHRIQFLLDSLTELAASIEALGSKLLVVAGKSVDVVPHVAKAYAVERVVAHRWSEPVGRERDRRVAAALDVPFDLYEGETLAAPGQVMTGGGTPFSVFGPFARAFAKVVTIDAPKRAPRALAPLPRLPRGIHAAPIPDITDLGIARNTGLVEGGEAAARKRLARFLRGPAAAYETGRNAMGEEGTSRISQDIKFGLLSPRTIWTKASDALDHHPKAARTYLNELVWRELAYHVLFHSPRVLAEPFRSSWNGFPWRNDDKAWKAWEEGSTGYPVVDASARQLLAEGFVHNRARMISASFLAKHLLLDFRKGEAHYLRWLTDGDWASNDLGWQWATGCGVDAQPWFRVLNPILQGNKFDADGAYVRRYVPELSKMPDRWIHHPWEAPPAVLAAAGVKLGTTYPSPLVDHAFARKRFLAAAQGHLGSASKRE